MNIVITTAPHMFNDFLEIGLSISFGNQILNISGFGALIGFYEQGRGQKIRILGL